MLHGATLFASRHSRRHRSLLSNACKLADTAVRHRALLSSTSISEATSPNSNQNGNLSSSKNKPEPALPSEADVVIVGGGAIGASLAYHLELEGLKAVLLERHEMTAGTTWHSAGMLWRLRPNDTDIQLHAYTRWLLKDKFEKDLGGDSNAFTSNGGLFIATNPERMQEYKRLKEIGNYFGIESEVLSPEEAVKIHPLLNPEAFIGAMHSPGDGTIDPTTVTNAYVKAWQQQLASPKALKTTRLFEGVGVKSIITEPSSSHSASASKRPKVVGVLTEQGQEIRAPVVVNACGAWANELHATALGDTLPLCSMQHAMIVTETIPGVSPSLPNVRDHDRSIYIKTQGNALALGGYEPNPNFWQNPARDFAFGLFDMDWEAFDHNLTGHMELCPVVETTGIQSTVCGPESFTPDHKPLVGFHPEMQGYFLACGMNSMGIMLSGGLGREMAQWINKGSAELDLFSYDISRFHSDCVGDKDWVQQTSHESYAKTYSIVHPNDEHMAGRSVRRSALHDALLERGCVFQQRHGFERPGFFATEHKKKETAVLEYDYYGAYEEVDIDADTEYKKPSHLKNSKLQGKMHEYYPYRDIVESHITFDWPPSFDIVKEEAHACRNGVAIFDQSYFGKFVIQGKEARAAVDYIATARFDEESCPKGRVKYTCLCNSKGGVEADLTITCLPKEAVASGLFAAPSSSSSENGDVFYVAAGGAQKTHNWRWFQQHTRDFDCEMVDKSDNMSLISVQGPHSLSLLTSIIDGDTAPLEELEFSKACVVDIAGFKVLLLRLTFVGERGYEIHCKYDDARQIYDLLMAKGEEMEQKQGVPVRDAGYYTIDSLSAEKGYRHWHADLSNYDTPFEANIGFCVSGTLKTTEKKFLGRQALEQQKADGVKRKLICLEIEDPSVPLYGLESIYRDGKCVGFIKSTAFGHTVGKTLAYGYISKEGFQESQLMERGESVPSEKGSKITNKWLKAGKYEVGDKGILHSAKIHLKAPFDPSNERI